MIKGEADDSYHGNSFLASELDDDEEDSPDSFSRESSVSSVVPKHPSQFDPPYFATDSMDDSDPNASNASSNASNTSVPYHHYLSTRDMMHHELLKYHGDPHHHHRGSYHSSAAASVNSSTLASPETSFAEGEFLEDYNDSYSENDNFSFDSLREKVQHGLALRHDQSWLEKQNIMKSKKAFLPFFLVFLFIFFSPLSC